MTKNLPSEVTPELVEKFKKALLEFKEPDEVGPHILLQYF